MADAFNAHARWRRICRGDSNVTVVDVQIAHTLPTGRGEEPDPMRTTAPKDNSELEAIEKREWLESLDYVIQQGDRGRVQRLLATLRHHARMEGVSLPF